MANKPIKSVIIIGGGLGGLALAQALRKSDITVNIFERDSASEARQQGFVLGLNENGIKALQSLDHAPLTAFFSTYVSRFRSFKLTDDKFEKLMQFPFGGKGQGVMIDRWILRDMLIEGLVGEEAGKVRLHFGNRLARYEEKEDKVVAYFEDGSTAEGDVLVGADGNRSRVREQRTTNIVYDELKVANIGALVEAPPRPRLAKMQDAMATSLIRVFGKDGVSLLAFPFTSPYDKKEYIVHSLTFPLIEPLPNEDAEMRKYVAQKAAKVNQEAVELIEMTPPENFMHQKIMHTCLLVKEKQPLGNTTRVTLMGDAAHAMTTHAGLGANTAFLDSVDLAKALLAPDWHSALTKYEASMIKRGYEAVQESLTSTTRLTQSGGKMRNYFMWLMGKVIGGEAKVEASV